MIRIYSISVLTFKEGIRERALFGIGIVSIMMLFVTIVITDLYGHQIGKVLVDLNLSTIAAAGLLLTFFVNINLIAKDIDKRTIYCVLSKPVSRAEYIVGKYMGLMMLLLVALTFLFIISSGITALLKAVTEEYYFRDFSWLCYVQAYFYGIMMFFILNAVIVFFSSISTSSFLTLLFSVGTYIAGQTVEEVVEYFKSEMQANHDVSHLNKALIEGVQYVFPNFSAFDIKILASHGKLVSMAHTAALTGYAAVYTLLLLYFAVALFNKREFT